MRLNLAALEDRSMLAAITGLVFFDNNADGIQNQAEANASGIAVKGGPARITVPLSVGIADLDGIRVPSVAVPAK